MPQTITSAKTSLKQISRVFSNKHGYPFPAGSRILDYGGGAYNLNQNEMNKRGCAFFIYDPFNRSKTENQQSMREQGLDFITCNNVLNVIDDDEAMIEAILRISDKRAENNAVAIFSVYIGDGSGIGKVTPRGYQRNQPLKWYYDMIQKQKCFKKAIMKNGIIICPD